MPIGGRGVTWQSVDLPIMSFAEQDGTTTLVHHGVATGVFAPYAWRMDANVWSELSRRLEVPRNYASGVLSVQCDVDVTANTAENITMLLYMRAVGAGGATNTDPPQTDTKTIGGMTANKRYTFDLAGAAVSEGDLLHVLLRTHPGGPAASVFIYVTAVRLVYLGF